MKRFLTQAISVPLWALLVLLVAGIVDSIEQQGWFAVAIFATTISASLAWSRWQERKCKT